MAELEKTAAPTIENRDYYTTMSHFYRGELGRIMVWRQRLDATTNWAILTATGVITFALGRPEISHVVFLLANLMVFLLLTIEGRRYRYYDAYRARVRMLEAHFLVPVVVRRPDMLEGDWRSLLAEDLLLPSYKMGVRESTGRRLNRNYIWIFLILLGSWALKIFIHGPPIDSLWMFLKAAQQSQPLQPVLFWSLGVVFYAILAALCVYGYRSEKHTSSVEVQRRAPSRDRWQI